MIGLSSGSHIVEVFYWSMLHVCGQKWEIGIGTRELVRTMCWTTHYRTPNHSSWVLCFEKSYIFPSRLDRKVVRPENHICYSITESLKSLNHIKLPAEISISFVKETNLICIGIV